MAVPPIPVARGYSRELDYVVPNVRSVPQAHCVAGIELLRCPIAT